MTEEKEKIIARLYCKLKHELRVYAARYCPDEAEDSASGFCKRL